MPSVKNPNTVGRNRSAARAAKARKVTLQGRKTATLPTRVAKADVRRGARAGLLPTSGPNAPLSKKKQRKVEKQLAHAIRRKREAEEAQAEQTMGELSSSFFFFLSVSSLFLLLLSTVVTLVLSLAVPGCPPPPPEDCVIDRIASTYRCRGGCQEQEGAQAGPECGHRGDGEDGHLLRCRENQSLHAFHRHWSYGGTKMGAGQDGVGSPLN